MPGGALDPVLASIAQRLDATPAQVIFAWVRSKRAIIITDVPLFLLCKYYY